MESGLAGSPFAWSPVAKMLEPDFRIVIHQRAGKRNLLPEIVYELRSALERSKIPPPYILVGHSFGGLVIRQFAESYPGDTAALLFVDSLPLATSISAAVLVPSWAMLSLAELLAGIGLIGPLLEWLEGRILLVDWAFQELRKLPEEHQKEIRRDWNTTSFYRSFRRTLVKLPQNLRIARSIRTDVLSRSMHSDYPDANGQRVDNAGHWIQVDRPEIVANAVRGLARAIIRLKGA